MATRPSDAPDASETNPDVLEQRQRVDGTYEVDDLDPGDVDRPLTADEIEQRQEVVGDGDDPWAEVPTDGPISPDVIEQGLPVDLDEDEPRDV